MKVLFGKLEQCFLVHYTLSKEKTGNWLAESQCIRSTKGTTSRFEEPVKFFENQLRSLVPPGNTVFYKKTYASRIFEFSLKMLIPIECH